MDHISLQLVLGLLPLRYKKNRKCGLGMYGKKKTTGCGILYMMNGANI